MAVIIPDEKKEEVREAADLVEVVGDYVKLKRAGRSWKGLCPLHDEKTPSFHVTPDMGIYKCFGCGESGDVFNFMMEMEGVGFVEAMRSLADRFGVTLPDPQEEEDNEEHHLREGIYHALNYAGTWYHSCLMELDEAENARQYLKERGYNRSAIKKFGLGYAPATGDKLFKIATDSGINKEYLIEAGLVKPSTKSDGYYDSFRGRLMFPIFNTSGKVIAFAGRILGDQKGAKYINSPQTKVYDKSAVLYGINFAKNEIRKKDEAILVEGYTDVITLHENGIENVIASSGTSLTPKQLKMIHRYGESLTMIYDSDSAGQKAMKRGINLALSEGLDVILLELPEGEDPDSFVSQFGKDSFLELKQEESEDFVNYIIHKAQKNGEWEKPSHQQKAISEALESIAHVSDTVARETYVQYLNKLTKVGDRALFEELGKKVQALEEEDVKARRRTERQVKRETADGRRQTRLRQGFGGQAGGRRPEPEVRSYDELQPVRKNNFTSQKRPSYEKELIRLMLMYDREMIDFIGSYCGGQQFEDEQLREFYVDIIERFKQKKTISAEIYAQREHPFPQLTGEIVMERYGVSERHQEKTGLRYERDKNRYATAKGALKALKLQHLDRFQQQLQKQLKSVEGKDRSDIVKTMSEVSRQRTLLKQSPLDELFPGPESDSSSNTKKKVFEYKMKKDL